MNDAMYDGFANGYAEHAATGPYNAYYDRPRTLELLGDVRGKVILDAACGPGLYAAELVKRGASVIGFDQSSEMIQLAFQRLGPRADLRVHDLTAPLDWLGNDTVDLVLVALAIHYVDDPVEPLREFRRVVRPAGAVVISTSHPTADWQRLGGSYFDVATVAESLRSGLEWPVRWRRAPLTVLTDAFHRAGFLIERLLEPLPVPEMADRFPDHYTRLREAPGFIAFRLVRTPA